MEALRQQIEVALEHNLPIIFHVRDAFDDFWPIFEEYDGIRGVLHSFTDSQENLNIALQKGLFIGVNGIATFTKQPEQLAMFDAIPLEKLMLETDAPFLTPSPLRGKINEPALVRTIGEFIAHRRGLSIHEVATQTTANAHALFAL
jgi:TatD DNase family protein